MTAILITLIFIAAAVGLFGGAALAGGSRAQLEQEKNHLRHHLQKILREADNGQITEATLQNARKTLQENQS